MGTSQGTVSRWLLGMLALGAALLFIGPAAVRAQALVVTKTFVPAAILSGNPTTLTVRLQNTDKAQAAGMIGFTDNFPAGMSVVPGDSAFQCGGTLTFFANAFTFTNGSVPKVSLCDVQVTVTAISPTSIPLINTTSAISYTLGPLPFSTNGASGVLDVTGGTPPTITSAPPPAGQVRVPYDYVVAVSGTAPIAVTASGLPPGLAFSPVTLHITGTPTTLGAYSGTIGAANGFPPNAVQNFTIDIVPPALTIVTPPAALSPPIALGSAIDVTLQAVGGVPPYLWSVAAGALPPGVTLSVGGRLTGKPSQPGTYTFVAQVNDSLGGRTTQTYTIDVVKIDGAFKVTVTPDPVISGQAMTVVGSVTGTVAATGTLDVWIAGAGTRCPAPFEFGDPASPVAQLRTALLDATGRAQVAAPNLRIDDYGVCAHYGGDANFSEAFAGPIDAYVIKGVLLPPPKVSLSVPGSVAMSAAIPAQVSVTPQDTTLVPGGAVRVLVDGKPVASATLAGGIAWVVLEAPATPATLSLTADYVGDDVFAPASSAPALVVVGAPSGLPIPALADWLIALVALLLASVAARRLRRRP